MKSKQAQVEEAQTTIEGRVRLGLEMKAAGEQMVAAAVQEKLTEVGEEKWLAWCRKEWGWSRGQAYKHLNPEQLEKDRQRKRMETPDVAPRQSIDTSTLDLNDYQSPTTCELPSASEELNRWLGILESITDEADAVVMDVQAITDKRVRSDIAGRVQNLIDVLQQIHNQLRRAT